MLAGVDSESEQIGSWRGEGLDDRYLLLSAFQAEAAECWHLAVRPYLICLDRASAAGDPATVRFAAARLSRAYRAMGMLSKAEYFRLVAD